MNKKKSYITLFKELSCYNSDTGISNFVCVNEFTGKFSSLKFGNGGSWCRFDGKFAKQYKIMLIYKNQKIRYSWDITAEEQRVLLIELEYYFADKLDATPLKPDRTIYLIKICGVQNGNFNRPINIKIKNYYKNKSCVVCGSNNDIVIDHKNGLYNDNRVLNVKTQKIDDFQTLCNHCNLQKRQTIIWSKKNNRRYPATKIPQLKPFRIDFTSGDAYYNAEDINAMRGTFWYDPIDFMKKITFFK